ALHRPGPSCRGRAPPDPDPGRHRGQRRARCRVSGTETTRGELSGCREVGRRDAPASRIRRDADRTVAALQLRGRSDVRKKKNISKAQQILSEADASLLDLVDHVLNKGVFIEGEVLLGLADVDLVYLRLAALLCAVDRLAKP